MADVITAWRRSLVGEICWTTERERPGVLAAVPLLHEGLPCVALPYALAERVDRLRAATSAAFVITDATTSTQPAAAAVGPVEVVDDLDGDWFTEVLLPQELVKHPPSRTYGDSPLLRRENWWWLPRIVVRLRSIERVVELAGRDDPARDALLVRDDGSGLRLDVVAPASSADWSRPRLPLSSRTGALRGDGAHVLAFGHAYTVDLERWETWSVRGTLRGDELVVTDRDGTPDGDLQPLRLGERLRRQRALERACRRGISAAERRRR
ncbi:MAG: hypothetical protein GEV07_03830 [Streptosporangiales bacterium]|nr:hypothetical protein [Streptosporangiales bacterium]